MANIISKKKGFDKSLSAKMIWKLNIEKWVIKIKSLFYSRIYYLFTLLFIPTVEWFEDIVWYGKLWKTQIKDFIKKI